MNCHLQVTVENFNELFEIKANVMVSEVQQCLPPPFTWVVCSQSSLEMTNHCNQSGGGVPVKHLENPSHGPVYLQPVPCNFCDNLVRCKFSWLQLEVFFPCVPFTGGSEDLGWNLMFLIKPHRHVVASPYSTIEQKVR